MRLTCFLSLLSFLPEENLEEVEKLNQITTRETRAKFRR
jgi:hypothetical protein